MKRGEIKANYSQKSVEQIGHRMSKSKGRVQLNIVLKIALIFVAIFESRCSESMNPKGWSASARDNNLNFFSNDFSTGYTVNTSGCSIPKMMLLDPSIATLVHHPWDIKPCPNKRHPLLKSNQTHIWTITKHFKHYKINNASSLRCCYRSFHQLPRLPIDDLADEVVYMECVMFQDIIEVSNQFVKVECYYNGKTINQEYFVFIPVKDTTDFRKVLPENGTKKPDFNVIVMGLDSVSRVNAHRVIPNTINFLLELGAVELFGYHAIGDDTLDNIIPILSGMTSKELNLTCWPQTKPTLDSCPFVWERFKYVGYQTALVEDTAQSKIFYSDKYGFREREADYYLHPFIHESEIHELNTQNKKKHKKGRKPSLVMNSIQNFLKRRSKSKGAEKEKSEDQGKKLNSTCLGDKYYFGLLLEYIERLTSTLRASKLFGFFWVSSLSRNLNDPMVMDDEFNRLIWKWYDTGYLNKTILILLSDKGINHGRIQNTKQGQLEQRLPLAVVLMPPAFRARYRPAYESLKINSNRLTTPFDLHETLIDLVDLNFIENSEEVFRKEDKLLYERGISLFIPIQSNRTCESAGIDDNWCTCHRKQRVRSQIQLVNDAVVFIITHLNGLLKNYPQCASLQIESVIDAEEMWPSYRKELEWREFRFEIRVKPGAGEYEALLRLDHGSWWSFLTQVRRLDTYNEPGHCVADDLIKWYCHCQ